MQPSQLAQSTPRQSVRSNQDQSNPHLVGAGGDRIEDIGQKTVGYATREGANVEFEFEAAKVRRHCSVVSLVEKGPVAVFTDSGGFIIPRSALEAAERTLLAATRSTH